MKKKICIVVSKYNYSITKALLNKSKKFLISNGIKNIKVVEVSGSFEIPVAISKLSKKYNGFIAIGCIIKGETNNFDIISNIITDAIMKLSIHLKKPIGNAILTCYNFKQAKKRIVKGAEAATAVLSVLKNV